jgi:capsule polysaccharide export protein KpsE/RkpR
MEKSMENTMDNLLVMENLLNILWFIMAICIVNNGVFSSNVMLIVMLMDVNGC